MRFRYVSLAGPLTRARPMLRVAVIGPKAQTPALILLDSGADHTLLPSSFAEALGLRMTADECPLASFAGPLDIPGRIGEARFQFGGGTFSFSCPIVAHPSVAVPVFGHSGFFERYRVTFDARNGLFFVDEHAQA
jgi:hypothetical protein